MPIDGRWWAISYSYITHFDCTDARITIPFADFLIVIEGENLLVLEDLLNEEHVKRLKVSDGPTGPGQPVIRAVRREEV